jgi:ascorbate-specific PTS system EIIC-type component UlaA
MISDQLSTVLRSVMIIAGIVGFLIGAGSALAPTISQGFSISGTLSSLPNALFWGTLLCVVAAVGARFFMMSVFRAYVQQLVIKRQTPEPADKPVKK